MKNYNKLILICAGLAPVVGVSAQKQVNDSTVNRTVVVENQYNPEVMDAFKVNVLPKIEEPAVAKKQIDYATTLYPLQSYPFTPMEAISRNIQQEAARRGYFRAAYGTRNNTDIKGAYLWDITSRDRLDVMASFYGYSGTIDAGYDFDELSGLPVLNYDNEWEHRFFRTDASLKYQHDFNKLSLNIGGDFASQVSRYIPSVKMGQGYIGVTSVSGAFPVDFGVQTGFKGFGSKLEVPSMENLSEQIVHTEGFMAGALNSEQRVGIDLSMDNVLYEKLLEDFTLLKLNPYYSLNNDDISLRIGAHVDFQTANGSGVKAAPDVEFAYTFCNSYVLYAGVDGGTKLNNFSALNEVSPFWVQTIGQVKTSYTPYDAKIGLKASPVDGLGLNVYGGYRETKDELFTVIDEQSPLLPYFKQAKAKVAYAGFALDYAYSDLIDFGFVANYYNWTIAKSGDNSSAANLEDGLLWLKPEVLFGFNVRAKVFTGMHAWLKYNYEGRKKCLGIKADPVNELNLGADYSFNNRANVFLSLNNLLNKNYVTQTGLPAQGFYLMAGVSVNF